jgi:hypothetical protein
MTIMNASKQDFNGGAFHLYYDVSSGTRTELTGSSFSVNYTGSLAAGATVAASYTAPSGGVATRYILVYQGTIGSSGGVALDQVDSGIAIAATAFNAIWNIDWSNPQTQNVNGGTSSQTWARAGFNLGVTWSGSTYPDTSEGATFNDSINTPQIYTGPATSCNLHLVYSGTGAFQSNAGVEVIVSQDGVQVLIVPTHNAAGTYDFPFTIAAGVNSVIQVQASLLGKAIPGDLAGTAALVGTFTP